MQAWCSHVTKRDSHPFFKFCILILLYDYLSFDLIIQYRIKMFHFVSLIHISHIRSSFLLEQKRQLKRQVPCAGRLQKIHILYRRSLLLNCMGSRVKTHSCLTAPTLLSCHQSAGTKLQLIHIWWDRLLTRFTYPYRVAFEDVKAKFLLKTCPIHKFCSAKYAQSFHLYLSRCATLRKQESSAEIKQLLLKGQNTINICMWSRTEKECNCMKFL